MSASDEDQNAPNPLGVDSYALFPSTVDDKKIDEIMRSSDLGARYKNGEFAIVHTTARDKNNNIIPFDKAVQQANDGSRKILNGPVEVKGIFVPNASAQGQVSREISCYRKPFEVKSI